MHRHLPAAAALLVSVLSAPPALAKDDLLETLAQKGVITMEEYEKLKAAGKANAGGVTVNAEDGFKLSNADGSATMQVGLLQQLDFAAYDEDKSDIADGSEFRRSRLSVSGTFFTDFGYRFEHEFSGTTGITDSYVTYNRLKPFVVTIGQFKQPFGMEALGADKNATFMERGLPFAFVITRAPGLMLGYSGPNWSANLGGFGEPLGQAQQSSPTQNGDEGYAVVGRATFAPINSKQGLVHLGLGYTFRNPTDDNDTATAPALPSTETIRFRSRFESNEMVQRLVDTKEIKNANHFTILGPELAAAFGPASIQGEWHKVNVDVREGPNLAFEGWYVQTAWTVTGEPRPYKGDRGIFEGIRPAHNFGKDGWGAFEVAARLSQIDLTDEGIHGGVMRDVTLGGSWYLNPLMRVSLNYVKVLSLKGESEALNGDEPSVVQARVQLAI